MNLTPLRRVGAAAATLALVAGALAATTASAHAAGPTGIVNGTVTQPGGAPLAGTEVRFFQANDPSTTADDVSRIAEVAPNGSFVQAVPAGSYQVTFRDYCEQFLDIEASVVVTASGETTLNGQFTTVDPAAGAAFKTDVCERVAPKLTGLPQVGVPLSVTAPVFAQAGVLVSYLWRSDGEIIPGVAGPVYVPGPQDVGNYVSVQAVGAKAGLANYDWAGATETMVKRGDYVFRTGPALIGLPIVGKSIAASPGALVPGAAVSYQWYRNGAAIAGQTARTYKVTKADYTKKLSAVITYKTYGYATVVRAVAAPFAAKNPARLSTKVSTGKKKASFTIKVSPSASKKARGTITISENGKTLKRVSIKSKSVTVTVSNLKKGKHKLTVLYEGRKNAASITKTIRIKK